MKLLKPLGGLRLACLVLTESKHVMQLRVLQRHGLGAAFHGDTHNTILPYNGCPPELFVAI
jgi:hypothetical protein